jgi:hypothetical protein
MIQLSWPTLTSHGAGLTFMQRRRKAKPAPATQAPSPTATASEDAQLYRNTTFGFRYQIPYGWVDRTKEMQEGNDAKKGEVLLAVFERPPEATGDTINSAVVIASESAASYPGLKKAEDYLGPLTELATAKGFKADGEPYALEVESRQLLRADFVKVRSDKLTMRQCTLVCWRRVRSSRFTFIAGSEDELDDLMDGLHFGRRKHPRTRLRPSVGTSRRRSAARLPLEKHPSLRATKNAVYRLDSDLKNGRLCVKITDSSGDS